VGVEGCMIRVEVRDFMLKIELPRSLFTNSMRKRILARYLSYPLMTYRI